MAKKNFFDRLTGSSPDIEEDNMEAEPKIKEQNFLSEEHEEDGDNNTDQEGAISSFKEDIEDGRPSKIKADNEEKSGETEGQLTVDVYQTESDVVIKSTIAGVSVDDLDIAITNDTVTIKGQRKMEEEIKPENYYWQECYWGPFSRSIILPVDVKAEGAKASLKNGILTIRLPKVEKIKTKKIKVEVF